jgi:hypothetical protein
VRMTHLATHLSPAHKTRDESYLDQGFADPAGILREGGDEPIGDSPSVRILRMSLSAPTKLFPLATEAFSASESV